jgi:hypothetical protein
MGAANLKRKANKSLAEELGEIVFCENISNSYYNDEHYVSCKTADFNKAYEILSKKSEITEEDLKSTCLRQDAEEGELEYTGLEVIKLVLTGDFGNQLRTTSSDRRNYECALATWEAMCKAMGQKTTERLWAKKETTNENIEYTGKSDYQRRYLSKLSLASIVGRHMKWDEFNEDDNTLRAATRLAAKLRHMDDFKEQMKPFGEDQIVKSIKRAEENNEVSAAEGLKAQAMEAAKYAKHKAYDKLQKTHDYYIRGIAIGYALTGHSHDSFFSQALKSIPSPSEMIKGEIIEEDIGL